MKALTIALTSDKVYPIHDVLKKWLTDRGYQVRLFGALKSRQEESWVLSAKEAEQAILRGECDEGIFCCWTGTGISIAANKLKEFRAALCTDAETAHGARVWNHANVLCLSNRLLTAESLRMILESWFSPYDPEKGIPEVQKLIEIDKI